MRRFVKDLLFVAVIALFIICFNLLSIKTLASSNNLSYYYEGTNELYDMTNENNPSLMLDDNGNPYKVDRYKDELIGKNITGNRYDLEFNVVADDSIVNIIPKYYFLNTGDHYSYGNGYAYYIKTQEVEATINGLTSINIYSCLKSMVLIIDYSSNLEEYNNISRFSIYENNKIDNCIRIIQYDYYTINNLIVSGGYILPYDLGGYNFSINNNSNNVVIPAPYYNGAGYSFEETNHYNIRNIICNEQLENLNDSNDTNGLFFNAQDIDYAGYKLKYTSTDFDPTNLLSIALDIAGFFEKNTQYFGACSLVLDGVSLAYNIYKCMRNNISYEFVSDTNNLDVNSTTKGAQLAYYGYLVKDSLLGLYNLILRNSSDYVDFMCQFSYSDLDERISTRFNTEFIYDIYFGETKLLEGFYNKITYDMYNSNISDISLDSKISNEYNNSNAYQTYVFEPYYSEDYYVNVTNSQNVTVKNSDNEEILKKSNGMYYLEKYQEYYIVVSNDSSNAKIYDIIIKTKSFENDILNVDILGNGEIEIIYHSYYNGVFAIDIDNDNIILDDELYIFEYGKKYSIIIKNSSSDVQNVTLKLYVPSTDTSDGNKYHRYVIEDNGIYKFDKYVYIYRTVYLENKKSGYEVELLTDDLIYYKGIDIDSEYIRPLYLVNVNGEDVTRNSGIEIEIGNTIDLKVYKYIDNNYVEYNFYNAVYNHVVTFGLVEIMINDYLTGAFIKRIYVFGSLASEKVEMSYSLDQNGIIESTLNLLYLDNLLSGVTKRVLKVYNVEVIKNNTDPVIEKEFDEDNKIQFNIDSMLIDGSYNFLKTYYILEFEYIVADITLTGEYILESILESSLYDFIMSKEVSEQYIENLLKQKNENNSININENNSININIILEHSKYIVASMNNINSYFEVYKPHQLVALIKEYTTYMEMSYDDEINYDAYLYGMAFYCNIRLMADLDFSGYIIDLSKINVVDYFGSVSNLSNGMYLYGIIDGNGKTISNLNIYDKYGNHLFIANYGLIQNVTFDELQGTLFKTYGPGEAYNIKLE